MSENPPKKNGSVKPTPPAAKKNGRKRADSKRKQELAPLDSEVTEAEIERIVELLPPEERHELLVKFASHKGWLPPPAMIREYEAALPGLAERIVAMPEREQSYRHGYLDRESGRQYTIRRRGQDYALAGMVLIFIFAAFLAVWGAPEWAARVVMVTLVGIVGIFVTGKWLDRKAEKENSADEEQQSTGA